MTARYPEHVVKRGDKDTAAVKAANVCANSASKRADPPASSISTPSTPSACSRRGSRFDGVPLRIHGDVGPLTWAALFAELTARPGADGPELLARVMQVAFNQIGVTESPPAPTGGRKWTSISAPPDSIRRAADFPVRRFRLLVLQAGRRGPRLRQPDDLDGRHDESMARGAMRANRTVNSINLGFIDYG